MQRPRAKRGVRRVKFVCPLAGRRDTSGSTMFTATVKIVYFYNVFSGDRHPGTTAWMALVVAFTQVVINANFLLFRPRRCW
jgi:hypothetical protein